MSRPIRRGLQRPGGFLLPVVPRAPDLHKREVDDVGWDGPKGPFSGVLRTFCGLANTSALDLLGDFGYHRAGLDAQDNLNAGKFGEVSSQGLAMSDGGASLGCGAAAA